MVAGAPWTFERVGRLRVVAEGLDLEKLGVRHLFDAFPFNDT